MSQLTKFTSLVALSTALCAAGCMAEATAEEAAADDTTVQTDEAKQAIQAEEAQGEEIGLADQESNAMPAMDEGSLGETSADPSSTGSGDEERVGESADASRFWGWGFRPWGWGGFHRPWGWGGFYRPWGFGGFYRPWGWGGFYRPWGFGGCGFGGFGGCGW